MDWVEATDAATNRVYYYNKQTKATQWTRPADMTASEADPADDELANWGSSTDSGTGRVYYYNRVTKKSSWAKPRCLIEVESEVGEAAGADGDVVAAWAEAADPATGRPYWFNHHTKQTTWINPIAAPVMTFNPLAGSEAAQSSADSLAYSMADAKLSEDQPPASPLPPPSSSSQPAAHSGGGIHALFDIDGSEVINENGSDNEDSDDEAKASKSKPAASTSSIRAAMESSNAELGSQLEFAKHRKGWFKRTFRVGEVFTLEKLLSYKKSLIKKALLKQNRLLDELCIQLFKNIMSFMCDRHSSKPAKLHLSKILRLCLTAPMGIRDELFVQLMKQLTDNPNKNNSEFKGWHFVPFHALLLSSFAHLVRSCEGIHRENHHKESEGCESSRSSG